MKLFELPLLKHFLQKHVRDVHLALSLLWCGIPFKDVGDADVKHRVVLCLLPPLIVAVNVRECCHFPAFQDHHSVIELTFASGGQPDVFGEKEGADDCGLLRLHQCNIVIDLILEQVLAEQALGEAPLRRKQVRSLEIGVHPHYRRGMVILDAVAGLRVVGDDFPAAAESVDIKLVEDGVPVLGRTNAILLELSLCGVFVKEFDNERDKSVIWAR